MTLIQLQSDVHVDLAYVIQIQKFMEVIHFHFVDGCLSVSTLNSAFQYHSMNPSKYLSGFLSNENIETVKKSYKLLV